MALVIVRRAVAGLVEPVLLVDEMLDAMQDALVVHGSSRLLF